MYLCDATNMYRKICATIEERKGLAERTKTGEWQMKTQSKDPFMILLSANIHSIDGRLVNIIFVAYVSTNIEWAEWGMCLSLGNDRQINLFAR